MMPTLNREWNVKKAYALFVKMLAKNHEIFLSEAYIVETMRLICKNCQSSDITTETCKELRSLVSGWRSKATLRPLVDAAIAELKESYQIRIASFLEGEKAND